jgi:hypothetical protein
MDVILETIGSLVVGAIGAGLGWGATEFVARPIRRFFDLRGEIIRRIAQYANVPARYKDMRNGTKEELPLGKDELARLREAQGVVRDLAAQMRGFAHNETLARWALLLRYDPREASEGLFGLSNDMDTYGDDRLRRRKMISKALRIPENIL